MKNAIINNPETDFNAITPLIEQLQLRDKQKVDAVVASKHVYMNDNMLSIFHPDFEGCEARFGMSDWFMTQLAQKHKIPVKYARHCLKNLPDLFDQNVNFWLKNDPDKTHLVRTYFREDGNVARAFLSDSYKTIDNFYMAKLILSQVQRLSTATGIQIRPERQTITDSNMYLRFVVPGLETKAKAAENYYNPETGKRGGGIMSGFAVKNSEVGNGRFIIAPRIWQKVCSNGLMYAKEGLAMTHLGGKLEKGNIIWSQETVRKNLELVMSQVKDVLKKIVSPDWLGQKVEEVNKMNEVKLEHPLHATVNMGEALGLGKIELNGLVNFFSNQGSGKTAWDSMQAITFHASNKATSEDQFRIERRLGELVTADVARFDHPRKNMLSDLGL